MLRFSALVSLSSCIVQGMETDLSCWGCFSKDSIIPCNNNDVAELELKCPDGDRIVILNVFYGQTKGSTTCRENFNEPFEGDNCSIPTKMAKAAFQNACDDKNTSCIIRFREDFYDHIDNFMDPCKDTTQFTNITYDCQSPSTQKPTQNSAPITAQISAPIIDPIPNQEQAEEVEAMVKATRDTNDTYDGVLVTIIAGVIVGMMLMLLIFMYKKRRENNQYRAGALEDPEESTTESDNNKSPFSDRKLLITPDVLAMTQEKTSLEHFVPSNLSFNDSLLDASESTAKCASLRRQQTSTQSQVNEANSLISNEKHGSPKDMASFSFYNTSNVSIVMSPYSGEKNVYASLEL